MLYCVTRTTFLWQPGLAESMHPVVLAVLGAVVGLFWTECRIWGEPCEHHLL